MAMTNSDLNTYSVTQFAENLNRIADAVERLAGGLPSLTAEKFDRGTGYVWDHEAKQFRLVEKISAVKLDLLVGIADQRDQLLQNSLRFYQGKPSNNALLWGARGMGKSSLVKAIHAHINDSRAAHQPHLILVEIHREDLSALPLIQNAMRQAAAHRFIIFCDDLSFDRHDTSYKSLKTMLEGGIEGRPTNVIFYATSNRRHILARDMIDNEQTTGLIPGEGIEEKVSLSDRFGLWLGFHACSQDEYLTMVHNYAKALGIHQSADKITAAAIEWSVTRGSRSGRVAWQFVQQLEN